MNLPGDLSDARTDKEKQEKSASGNREGKCRECGSSASLSFWCETCQRLVPEKRCPNCGLKARKIRSPSGD